jgi:hypothetical protein
LACILLESLQPLHEAGVKGNDSNRRTTVNIYFVAKTVGSDPPRVTQGVVDRKHWVALKKLLATDGFVITYWNAIGDSVWDDVAA